MDGKWNTLLAHDYAHPRFHISYPRAIGRRLRKNYAYILTVQAVAYYGKVAIHPTAVPGWEEFLQRAAIGPVPGLLVVTAGLAFHGSWMVIAASTLGIEVRSRRRQQTVSIG
jgi:uncharacterized membrane protein